MTVTHTHTHTHTHTNCSLNNWDDALHLKGIEVVLHDAVQQDPHFLDKRLGSLKKNGEELVHDAVRRRGGKERGEGWFVQTCIYSTSNSVAVCVP